MMRILRLPMHRARDILRLTDMLQAIPDNDWTWRVVDFWGVGPTFGITMPDFEGRVGAEPDGLPVTWRHLKMLADSLDQTIDCLIVLPKDAREIDIDALIEDQFVTCRIVIHAVDSTEWIVGVDSTVEGDEEIYRKWKELERAAERSNT